MIKIDACDIVIQDKPQGCAKIGTCDMNGCYKLTVFDWLNDVPKANGEKDFPFVEVRFKNSRKAFFSTNNLTLYVGDTVAVEAASGHDIGVVSVSGEMARLQMQKKKLKENSEKILKVYRKASQQDIDKWQRYRLREEEVKYKSREYVIKHGLKMKISDVEFQGDGSKVTFYYTADGRVDFRSLIKDLAREFSTRIEMRQIGFRQEAARLGGVGSCGRELCCSSWMSDFRSVSTSAAKYQQLSLNPQKLAGQCGKLKCCLNFELDSYVDALSEFPAHNVQLQTEKGNAKWIKSDIFKGHLWYMYTDYKENGNTWHKLTLEQVNEIVALNKEGKKVASIEEYASELAILEIVPADNFEKVVGQDNINRFDEVKPRRRKKRRKKPNRNRNNQNKGNTQNKQTNQNLNKPKKQNPNQKKDNRQKPKAEGDQNAKRNNKNRKRRPNNRNNQNKNNQNKGNQNEK
jgi:cell fate regulator YaaT (PSP1 superfamily)